MKVLLFIIVMFFTIACKHDGCEPESTRCDGEIVQICNTEEDWEDSLDCDSVSVGELEFACEKEDGTHSCILVGGVGSEGTDGYWDAGLVDGGSDV